VPHARPARTVWPFVLGIAVLGALTVGLGAWLLHSLIARQPIEVAASVPPATRVVAPPSTTLAARSSTTATPAPPPTTRPVPVNVKSAPPPASTGALRVGGEIKEPKRLTHVNPSYPDIARQARVQGVVILECRIGPQGNVTDVKVLRGIPLLDQAAIEAVKQWVYAPTLLNGVPVSLIMTVTVNFKLS
jgi:protein TonB